MIQEKFRKYFEKSWVLLLGTGYILRDVLALHKKVPGHTGKMPLPKVTQNAF